MRMIKMYTRSLARSPAVALGNQFGVVSLKDKFGSTNLAAGSKMIYRYVHCQELCCGFESPL
jgi:hypothetical protein